MRFYLLIIALIFSSQTAWAQVKNENLLSPLPPGFKVGSSSETGSNSITEFVPINETVHDWTTMITVQLLPGLKLTTAESFAAQMKTLWIKACNGGDARHIKDGIENGYQFTLWMLTCQLNPQTTKPENMWLKVINGKDSLYVVQYAYRKELAVDLISPAMNYLQQVTGCDTRNKDQACPQGIQ